MPRCLHGKEIGECETCLREFAEESVDARWDQYLGDEGGES